VTDAGLARARKRAVAVAVAGLGLSALGALVAPTAALRAWLMAWVFWTALPLGCIALLMVHYVTGGAWGAVIRRLLEAAALTVPLMALLFVPVALGAGVLYPWADPAHVEHDPVLQAKRLYLNVPFFVARTVGYFVAWSLLARALARWSLAQDTSTDPLPGQRLHLISRGGLVLMGLTMSFAAVDWMMSLEPHWASTIYGIIFMGGSVLTAFAFVIPSLALLADRPALARVVSPNAFHDLGKLMLAFVMLWAYFAFSQFLIVWGANLPEEIPWYLSRGRGGWQWLSGALIVFHFALPFVVLLSRGVKRSPRRLALVALALGGVRYLDIFWLMAPAFHPDGFTMHWLDLTVVVGVGGLWVALFVTRLDARPLVPANAPELARVAA
jgi:hypothetical protein